MAWVASVAALAGLGWAAIAHHDAIEHAWPASARLFSWLTTS